ncbi:hypothetical protein RHSIM_RhsimUnG0033100 [Rhododendron simsii]|uniref:Uncharacterized protein n=1 Tax=Rhododendron simsii TaxID=118357 RepID=A0A834FXJ2_RHOSS|nr:hypothetical protein RHSIM_RhsimUnG0033100 [Rhododendron simsii]
MENSMAEEATRVILSRLIARRNTGSPGVFICAQRKVKSNIALPIYHNPHRNLSKHPPRPHWEHLRVSARKEVAMTSRQGESKHLPLLIIEAEMVDMEAQAQAAANN